MQLLSLRVIEFATAGEMRSTSMKAWLITWEWTGEAAAVADRVVGVLNPRWTVKRVSEIIEFLYIECTSTLAEIAMYARNSDNNPYRAKRDFNGQITCGQNPWLWARLVDDLEITADDQTRIERVTWREVPIYCPTDNGFKELRGHLSQEYVRQIAGSISNELIWDRGKGTYKNWW